MIRTRPLGPTTPISQIRVRVLSKPQIYFSLVDKPRQSGRAVNRDQVAADQIAPVQLFAAVARSFNFRKGWPP
jgi:hypothetical protein